MRLYTNSPSNQKFKAFKYAIANNDFTFALTCLLGINALILDKKSKRKTIINIMICLKPSELNKIELVRLTKLKFLGTYLSSGLPHFH